MVKNTTLIELKTTWENHTQDSGFVTPANKNSGIEAKRPTQDEILQQAKAGWVTKDTYAKGDKDKTTLLMKERLSQIASSANASVVNQGFINRMATEVESQISMIRFELRDTHKQIETVQEEMIIVEGEQKTVEAQATFHAKELIRAAEEEIAALEELQLIEEQHETAQTAMELADGHGGLAEAQAAAQQLAMTAEQVEHHVELCDEKADDVSAAQTRLTETQEQITQFESRLSDLQNQANTLGEKAESLSVELSEYEAFHDYLQSPEVEAKLARGGMTLDELKANGMPDTVANRVLNDTAEITTSYGVENEGSIWSSMRDGLSEAATSFFESTGLSGITNSFGMAAANNPEAPKPALDQTIPSNVPTPTPAGTVLG